MRLAGCRAEVSKRLYLPSRRRHSMRPTSLSPHPTIIRSKKLSRTSVLGLHASDVKGGPLLGLDNLKRSWVDSRGKPQGQKYIPCQSMSRRLGGDRLVKWLLEEEMPIIAGPTVPAHTGGGFGVKHTMGTMAVLVQRLELFLRGGKGINNGRLFWKANLIVYAFATDGSWDPRSGLSLFSSHPFPFSKVQDGGELSIDPHQGVLVFD